MRVLLADHSFELLYARGVALQFRENAAIGPVLDEPADPEGLGPVSYEQPEAHALHVPHHPETYANACHAAAPPGP